MNLKQWLERVRRNGLLLTVILGSYAPFLGFRLIRTTGDEKPYIAQAFEMADAGNWFLQILNGEPHFLKGPFHYICIRLGLYLFGNNLWSALYMNLILCILGALGLAEIVRATFPQKKAWPFVAGCFFAFNVGVYGHLLASQMEVELAGIFGLAYYFLWKDRPIPFWLLAGLTGWIKSPLHSVLLGTGALLYWILRGEFFKKLKNKMTWFSAGAGILLCLLGYAPGFFLDRLHFVDSYIYTETLRKGYNGGPWWQSLVSILSYYLIPWMTLAWLSMAIYMIHVISYFYRFRKFPKISNPKVFQAFQLSLGTLLPTVIFFCYHPYRGENYTMPVTASFVLLFLCFWNESEKLLLHLRNWILGMTSLSLLVLPIALQAISFHFQMSQNGWPAWFMPSIWFFSLLSVGLQIWEHFFLRTDGLGVRTTLGSLAFLFACSLLLLVFGEMEVAPLKARLREDHAQGKTYSIYYWNLRKNIWNECALVGLSVGERIRPLLTEQDVRNAIERGDLILGRDENDRKELLDFIQKYYPHLSMQDYPWPRWRTHGTDPQGNSLLKQAWDKKDLSVLHREAVMVRFLY